MFGSRVALGKWGETRGSDASLKMNRETTVGGFGSGGEAVVKDDWSMRPITGRPTKAAVFLFYCAAVWASGLPDV